MSWYKSTQIIGGALIAIVGSLGTSGVITPELATQISTALGAIIAALRLRPNAGTAITGKQQ